MTTVTQYYGISGAVPFENVHVHEDNRKFVDSFSIRLGRGPTAFVTSANACTASFFDQITAAVVSPSVVDHRHGLELLKHFEEPRETRLGMSQIGFRGHGGADGIGQAIWDVLTGDAEALVRVGVLKHIEEIPLFVEGVGNDITSDLTTRVIFEPLVDFTNEMVNQFPELAGGSGVRAVTRQVWDPVRGRWAKKLVDLPTVDGEPLLLVPKEWVRPNLTLTSTRLYETTLLSHVQMERATITEDGKILKTPKDRLKEDERLARGYDTIIRIVEDAYGKGTDIVADFKRFAQERYNESA